MYQGGHQYPVFEIDVGIEEKFVRPPAGLRKAISIRLRSMGQPGMCHSFLLKFHTRLRALIVASLVSLCLTSPNEVALGTSENPFPGVPFEGEIPGYTVEVPCQSDGDCGIGIVPVISCPAFSAADGRNGYANDGPPGDPHKKVGFAKRFCRNSWLPPTTQADDEDYQNRQKLAQARATEESQAWNAANPGKQKCVQWGPIVHANGVSTASGGVCANPVEAGAGTTVPSQEAASVTAPTNSESPSSSPSPTPSPSASSNSSQFTEDTSYRGSGFPFTKIFRGQLSTNDCPIGYQGANGLIAAIGIGNFTECWPENAWQANRLGGDIWEQFKSSNGTYDVMAELRRRENVQALKAEARKVAEAAANQTPGIQRCSKWTGYGETGTECAYSFINPSSGSTTGNASSSDSSTTTGAGTSESTTSNSSSGATTNSGTSNRAATSTNPSTAAQASVDYSQYGIGKPFTRIVEGSVTTSKCPAGYQAASNYFEWLKATECWPEDAWLAYSKGGSVWSSFKQSLGGQSLQIQVEREMRINAVRALALQQAQELSWKSPGLRRCMSWSVFDKSGSECSFVPRQNGASSEPVRAIVDTPSVTSTDSRTVVRSVGGLTRAEWTSSLTYSQLDCPSGSAKETSLNLNGTADTSDDTWITECLENKLLRAVESITATLPVIAETPSVSTVESAVAIAALVDTAVAIVSAVDLEAQSVEFIASADEVVAMAGNIETDEVAGEIAEVIRRFSAVKTLRKSNHIVTASEEIQVTYETKNPRRCLVRAGGEDFAIISFNSNRRVQIKPVRSGTCEIAITLTSPSGNSYSTSRTYKN